MSYPWIDPLRDRSTHALEHRRAFIDARFRDMGVDVRAAEEHRRPFERPGILPRRPRRADQSAAVQHDAAVASGVARREFRGEACALREPEQHDAVLANT